MRSTNQKLSIFEKLSLSTVRIECELQGGAISTGTGFFVRYVRSEKSYVLVIVINKHVVAGAIRGSIYFTLSDETGNPLFGSHHRFDTYDFERPWLNHPNPSVDLCAMPISALVTKMGEMGLKPNVTFIDLDMIPSKSDIDEMAGMERITMIGYPNGLWDATHNQPVFRSGVLASHYTRKGLNLGSSRIKFLGVLYAGPVLAADGSIEILPVPTSDQVRARTNIPINLGYVIKSRQLLDFEDVFQSELNRGHS